MRYFKDKKNNIYAIDEGFEHLLPENCVEITKQQALIIANSKTKQVKLTPEQNIAAIKAKARQLILTRAPEYKQRNYLARKLELQDKLIMGQSLTPEEQAEFDFITAEWQWIKAVREVSNTAEASGTPVDEIVWPV